jgi:glycosyltransferase involved in cell wall biosynthesis
MGTRARLTVVGSGPEADTLRTLAASLGVAAQVDFLGALPRAEVLSLYRQHDVFLFPSLHDSGGIVVLEAMYLELPVVCIDAGGPAVSVGDAGIRVPCTSREEVIAGLAGGVKSILDSASLAADLRDRAKQRVCDLYDWEAKPRFLRELYRRVAMPAPVS